MVKASHGPRRRTRKLFRKSLSEKKPISISRYMQEFDVGDKVLIHAEPSIQKGLPFKRFVAKVGIVAGKRGNSYILDIQEFNKKKMLIVNPIHLRKL